jgi:neutral amino acid transport system substrate-binding protein
MRITKMKRAAAGAAALALTLTACGGNGDDESADTETAPAEDDEEADTDTDTDTDTEADGETEETASRNEGDGQLTVGTLLPETGSLAFLGPPEFAGAELAVQDINEAGGVLGEDVVLIQGDSGDTTTDIANQTVDRLLSQDADVIVGAASSAVSFTVIDKIVSAGVVQFSPANTSAEFTTYEDDGLYFRTAPSDILQGQVLGDLIVEDGNATVGIMALQDPYGEGLADTIDETVSSAGGEVVAKIIYDPQAQNFDAEVQQLVDADPDAIAVIGFDESARILTALFEAGIGVDSKAIYGSDGNMGNALGENFTDNPQAITGMKGTTPLSELDSDFEEQLLEVDPDLTDFNYASETYDAIIVTALAVIAADSDVPTEFAQEIAGVTKDGTDCSDFAECKELLEGGEDINYNGRSGPIELDDVGDPGSASFAILVFNDEATLDTQEYIIAGGS